MSYTQQFNVREGEVVRCFDAVIYDALVASNHLEKSAATKVSEYFISLTTLDTYNTYKNYTFSLNGMEATFSSKDDTLLEIVLRDTAVHKKVTLKSDKSTLTYAKGQDTVGKHSEINDLASKEPIYSITINDKEFFTPLDVEEVYEHLTGINLESARQSLGEDVKESTTPINWWTAFLNSEEADVSE